MRNRSLDPSGSGGVLPPLEPRGDLEEADQRLQGTPGDADPGLGEDPRLSQGEVDPVGAVSSDGAADALGEASDVRGGEGCVGVGVGASPRELVALQEKDGQVAVGLRHDVAPGLRVDAELVPASGDDEREDVDVFDVARCTGAWWWGFLDP